MATKVNVIALQSELNNVLKNEHNSFSSLISTLKGFKDSQAMKDYLNAANLTFNQLIDLDYYKGSLTYATFKVGNKEYQAIARKDYKTGEMKPAKWSFWLILSAARKTRKEEIKAAEKAAKEAKEKSLAAIEAEGKEAKESKSKGKK